MVAMLRRVTRGNKGLTLLEMAVVGAILSILAGLTSVAVTGSSTAASGAALEADTGEVGKAVAS
jgi:prepilin-type N-terminal cleavage/methylation domain-containing protein